ncbi:hypothetical protein [Aquimarina rhabdastrellae]
MKLFIYFLIVAAFGLLIYNTTLLNFSNLLDGDSGVALIGVLASLCVIALMLILLVSRAIAEKKGR